MVLPLADGWLDAVKQQTGCCCATPASSASAGREFVNRAPGAQAEVGSALTKVDAGLRPPTPVRFPLSSGAEALQSLADGEVRGKLVLEP